MFYAHIRPVCGSNADRIVRIHVKDVSMAAAAYNYTHLGPCGSIHTITDHRWLLPPTTTYHYYIDGRARNHIITHPTPGDGCCANDRVFLQTYHHTQQVNQRAVIYQTSLYPSLDQREHHRTRPLAPLPPPTRTTAVIITPVGTKIVPILVVVASTIESW